MQKHCPKLITLAAYGTDGERALVKAFELCFPNAVGVRCFIHKKKNIEHHLNDKLHISTDNRNQVLAGLFGKRDGANYYAGLVDAESEEILDNDLKVLESRWECLAPGFHRWFVREKSSDFKRA